MAKSIYKKWIPSFTTNPILGCDSFISNNPNQQTSPVRTSESDLTPPPRFTVVRDASHASVGGSSDPKAVPGSDPLLRSGDFIVAEGGFKSFEPKRAKRAKRETDDGGETVGWLPTGWTIFSKTRANGKTTGITDKVRFIDLVALLMECYLKLF